jgi:hypothetical protein
MNVEDLVPGKTYYLAGRLYSLKNEVLHMKDDDGNVWYRYKDDIKWKYDECVYLGEAKVVSVFHGLASARDDVVADIGESVELDTLMYYFKDGGPGDRDLWYYLQDDAELSRIFDSEDAVKAFIEAQA